ncbi:hypothetical protein U5801_11820 [Lamprobacter modestohalophilus]|uniref:hypothetical protein n=1 Tax=Lamprobacter modestohalophilus TaxID=1064514 RepID=UPI002ADEED20|nr:hypothetical protein [Lamprobacter modestohalophilus]MEA1050492.1 hypothetical protein [Lamprobacter modestohalophilus]
MSKVLPQAQVEQRLAELAHEREQVLQGYVPEVEAARKLGTSRQALHKRPDRFKREIGGARSPDGWFYRVDKLEAHIHSEAPPKVSDSAPLARGVAA